MSKNEHIRKADKRMIKKFFADKFIDKNTYLFKIRDQIRARMSNRGHLMRRMQ
jgi:hypothetical protein